MYLCEALSDPCLLSLAHFQSASGVVGIFVPILPTTPFLLLAAACYARSSPRFLNWLLDNPWFGAYLRNYRAGQGIPRKVKLVTLTVLWATIAISIAYAPTAWWVKILLGGVGLVVSSHLILLRTYRPSTNSANMPADELSAPQQSPKP